MSARVTVARWTLPSKNWRCTLTSGRGRISRYPPGGIMAPVWAPVNGGQRAQARGASTEFREVRDFEHRARSVRQRLEPDLGEGVVRVVDQRLDEDAIELRRHAPHAQESVAHRLFGRQARCRIGEV